MADQVYRVRTVYDVEVGDARASARALRGDLDDVGQSAQRTKGMLGQLGGILGGLGAVMALRAAVRDVIDLGSAAEGTRIALAGMIQAGGAAGDIDSGLSLADDLIQRMREHARVLPGTFEDLKNVLHGGLLGGLAAGKSLVDVEKVSADVMAVSKVLGIQSDQAGREFAMMMEGRAGQHVALFARLRQQIGLTAEEFNALSARDRWDRITNALKGYGDAIAKYQSTWDAVSSTSADYFAEVRREAEGATFRGLTSALAEVNAWYEKNRVVILNTARDLGGKLASAVKEAFSLAKDTLGWVVDHKDALLAIAAAWAGVKIFGAVRGGIAGAGGDILKSIIPGEVFDGMKGFGGQLSAAVAGLTVFAAALEALAAWVDFHQTGELRAQTEETNFGVAANQHDRAYRALDDAKNREQAVTSGAPILQHVRDLGALGPQGFDEDALRNILGSRGLTEDKISSALINTKMAMSKVGTLAPDLLFRLEGLGPGSLGQATSAGATLNVTNHFNMPVTINEADNPDRVYVDVHRAVRDAALFPKESTVALGANAR